MTGDITPAAEKKLVRKIMWRIMPMPFFLFFVAYLDRVNLGYAALQMNQDLALTSQAFGFAAGIFFIGSVFFEIPSNMMVLRFGPRKWIARIIITWGIVATLTAFVQTANQLYILRFILGAAEAGFIPGMVYYLTTWFRDKDRAFATGLFMASMPVTYLIGAPISTLLMRYMTLGGIPGWRWMLFLEGLPALLGGILCFWLLTETADEAKWLNPQEKAWLASEFEREKALRPEVKSLTTWQAMANPTVLHLTLIYFLSQMGFLGIGYWFPQIIRDFSSNFSLTDIGLIAGLPYAIAGCGLLWWSRLSDRMDERKYFTAIPLALSALCLFVAGKTGNPYLALLAITLGLTGLFAMKSPFFSMMTQIFSHNTVGVSVAIITAIGNCGGFFGPYVIGLATKQGNTSASGLIILSGTLLLAAVLTIAITIPKKTRVQAL